MDNKSGEVQTKTYSGVFVCGYEYHLDLALVKLTQERWLKLQDHDLVSSLSDNPKSQTHSRVPECDCRPSVQVKPGSINRMVIASVGVQTDLSKVVHSLFATRLNHKLPLYISPVPDQNAWDIDALNINWPGLTAYAYPLMALLYRVIQTIRQCNCLIIVIAPGWPGMPMLWDLVQRSTEIPLQLPVSTTLLKQSHNYVFHSNPQHLNLHAWGLGVNKASLWRWQREFLPLKGHQQGPFTSQGGPYLRNDGLLHSLCETSLRLFHVPVPRSKQAPFDH